MIPINRENVRDVIIVVLCIAAAYGLFYLAGCSKPAAAENLPTKIEPTFDLSSPMEGLEVMAKHSPKCPDKTYALAALISDPGFPDVWRGAYLCNAREIVPGKSDGKWHYADQQRYGNREWGQK